MAVTSQQGKKKRKSSVAADAAKSSTGSSNGTSNEGNRAKRAKKASGKPSPMEPASKDTKAEPTAGSSRSSPSKQADNVSGEEAQRLAAGQRLMSLFWDLASVSGDTRKAACVQLSSLLKGAGAGSSDVTYGLKRLVRGLASSRKAARQGFATVLTQLLQDVPEVTLEEVWELMEQTYKAPGSAKAQEIRDAHFGTAFGLGVLVRSGRLTAESKDKKAKDTKKVTVDFVASQLVKQGHKKIYLHAPCCAIAAELIQQVKEEQLSKQLASAFTADEANIKASSATSNAGDEVVGETEGVSGVSSSLASRISAWNLAMMLAVENRFGTDVAEKAFSPVFSRFGGANMTNKKSLAQLCDMLADLPKEHPVWALLMKTLKREGSDKALRRFWSIVVDDGMFHPDRATHTRKALGFSLLLSALDWATAAQVPFLLTRRVITTLINNLANKDTYLHPVSKLVSQKIVELAGSRGENGDEFCLALVASLTGEKGSRRFDSLSKSKTVEGILSHLSAAGVEAHVASLQKMFVDALTAQGDDAEDAHAVQLYAVEQLLSLVRNDRVPHTEQWVMSVAQFLLSFAFFKPSSENLPKTAQGTFAVPEKVTSLDDDVRTACQNRFYSALAELGFAAPYTPNEQKDQDQFHSRALDGTTADGDLRVSVLMTFVLSLLDGDVPMAIDTEEEHLGAMRRLCDAADDVHKRARLKRRKTAKAPTTSTSPDVARAFEILFLQVALQTFHDGEGVASVVEDLVESAKGLFAHETDMTRKSKSSAQVKDTKKEAATPKDDAGADEEDDEGRIPEPAEVVVDVLLSLLSKPSSLLRSVVDQVFRVMCPLLNVEALDLLFEVLQDEDSGLEADQAQADQGDESEVEEDHTHDTDNDSEQEAEQDGSDDDEVDSDENDSGEESEDDEEDDSAINRELKEKLMQEMKIGSDGEDLAEESEDSDWDDERMMAVDEAIAKHFQIKSKSSKTREEERRARVHFKLRVLDLFDIYIKRQPSSPLVLELIQPLMQTYSHHSSDKVAKPLLERIAGLVKNKLSHSKQHPRCPELDAERAHAILEDCFEAATASKSPVIADMARQSFLFVLKCLLSSPSPTSAAPTKTPKKKAKKASKQSDDDATALSFGCLHTEQFFPIFKSSLHTFATKKNANIRVAIFTETFKRFPAIGFAVGDGLCQALEAASNSYRQAAVVGLLTQVLQHRNMYQKHTTLVSESLSALPPCLCKVLDDVAIADEGFIKIKAVRNLLKLAQLCVKAFLPTSEDQLDKDALAKSVRNLLCSTAASRSPPVKTVTIQILRALSAEVPSQADMQQIRLELAERAKERKTKQQDDKDEERDDVMDADSEENDAHDNKTSSDGKKSTPKSKPKRSSKTKSAQAKSSSRAAAREDKPTGDTPSANTKRGKQQKRRSAEDANMPKRQKRHASESMSNGDELKTPKAVKTQGSPASSSEKPRRRKTRRAGAGNDKASKSPKA